MGIFGHDWIVFRLSIADGLFRGSTTQMQIRKYVACALPYNRRLLVLHDNEVHQPFLVVVAVARN